MFVEPVLLDRVYKTKEKNYKLLPSTINGKFFYHKDIDSIDEFRKTFTGIYRPPNVEYFKTFESLEIYGLAVTFYLLFTKEKNIEPDLKSIDMMKLSNEDEIKQIIIMCMIPNRCDIEFLQDKLSVIYQINKQRINN